MRRFDDSNRIIMSYIQNFLRSFIKHIPRIHALSDHIQSKSNLLVNYPLSLQLTASNRLAIHSNARIAKDNNIILIAAGECIFSEGFSGALASQEKKMSEDLQQLSSQYESMNQAFMGRMKIYLQLLAGKQELQKGEMSVKDFTEYILGSEENVFEKGDINSRYLSDLYRSWEISNKITYSFLKKEFLKRVEEEEFIEAVQKGKQFIRSAGNSPFLFAAPFLDKFDHSFQPNCEFDMLYLPHLRGPFIRIRTLHDILPGQRATINYGQLTNYELLLRYGFCIKDNPYSVFMLPLNFQNIVQIFNKNIEWKQNQMMARNMKLKNFVKIKPSGQIAKQDLMMMRILICDAQNPEEGRVESDLYDKLIYKFIGGHAQHMRKNIKLNNYLVSKNKNVNLLENEEISILDNFLSQHTL